MISEHYDQSESGERMTDNTPLEELKQVTIDYYVNLKRIKKADTGNNPELAYQLKVVKINWPL